MTSDMARIHPWPVIVDGELRADGRVDVLVFGGGFQHGEGLFETFPLVRGRGHFLKRHLERLNEGARVLELVPSPPRGVWEEDLFTLSSHLPERNLAVRLFLFRDGDCVRRIVAATPLPKDRAAPARVGMAEPPLDRPRELARWKTMNYLAPRLAHRLGERAGFDEVLFATEGGVLLEGTRSSLFLVKDGVLRTPPLSLPVLPGVTREVLLEVARTGEIPTAEEKFGLADLLACDEAFLTASLRGVRPIQTMNGSPLRGVGGPITLRLAALYADCAEREASSLVP